MRRRAGETIALVVALLLIVLVSVAQHRQGSVSTFSSFDRGRNGYLAIYNVLAREDVPVARSFDHLSLAKGIGVLVVTENAPERLSGNAYEMLSRNDVTALRAFARKHRIVVFAHPTSTLAKALHGFSVQFTDPSVFSNDGLARDPNAARRVYDAVAGRGVVAFYERLHGYSADRSFWEALPPPVHVAVWIALVMLLLALVAANVRFAPAMASEAPPERDSSAYIHAMASLLRRARARHAVVEALAADAERLAARRAVGSPTRRSLDALRGTAEKRSIDDAAVVRAAQYYAAFRKELG